MSETNKVNPLAGAAMAFAQRLGMGSQPAEPTTSNDEPGHDDQVSAAGEPASDEPTERAHDEHAGEDDPEPVSETDSQDEPDRHEDDETNDGGPVDYLASLEAPIAKALAEMATADATHEKGRLPYAIKVGMAFLAAKASVVVSGGSWTDMQARICEDLDFKPRTANNYMLLAQHADLSHSCASIIDALREIAKLLEAKGKKRKSPAKKKPAVKSTGTRSRQCPDLTEMISTAAPDEVRVALSDWDPADKRELRRGLDQELGDGPVYEWEPPPYSAEVYDEIFRQRKVDNAVRLFLLFEWEPTKLREVGQQLLDAADAADRTVETSAAADQPQATQH
jgi:hypothetical protein